MRASEIVCVYLEVEPSIPLFLFVFHLHRLRDADGKFSWVSFKHPKKLFAIYPDSIMHFKERFFIVKPLTQEVDDHLFEIVNYMEDREQKRGPSARFPLEWKYDNFQWGTNA